MKFWKHILITTFAFIGIAAAVFQTSCNEDPCYGLICRNGGTCVNGYCNCVAGFEGGQCERRTVEQFVGTYHGITKINEKPVIIDSAFVTGVGVNKVEAVVWSEGDILNVTVENNGKLSVTPRDPGSYGSTNVTFENNKMIFYVEKQVDGEKYVYTFTGNRYIPEK